MDPTKKNGSKVSSKIKNLLNRTGFNDKTLKIIFLVGLMSFGLALFLFKFEILSYLSNDESTRLASVTNLKNFINNPTDPIQGLMQWASLKALPSHHIFALRAPSAILVFLTLALTSVVLYLKFRNRYLPYTFALLAISSPWTILLSHQGYMPGIDILALVTAIYCGYYLITSSDIKDKWKKYSLLMMSVSTGLIAIQPFGPFILTLLIVLGLKSEELRNFINSLNKKQKILLLWPVFILPLINIGFLLADINNWKLISGLTLLQNPIHIPKDLIFNTRSIFGIEQSQGLSLGTGRPDLLLMAALALTVYEIFKKRICRKELVVGLSVSLIISALYGAPTSIVLTIPFTIAILALALANMIRIIDAAFPLNPYPRNIARTGMLLLICLITVLNVYTFITATARENTPQDINQITIARQSSVE